MVDFVAGTITIFNQTSAPTGWTKITTYDDHALRVVAGSTSVGGSLSFSSCLTTRTWAGSVSSSGSSSTGTTTLSAPQIPFHTHTFKTEFRNPAVSADNPASGFAQTGGAAPTVPAILSTPGAAQEPRTSNATGGGGSHAHPISLNMSFTGGTSDFSVNYMDVILASKN